LKPNKAIYKRGTVPNQNVKDKPEKITKTPGGKESKDRNEIKAPKTIIYKPKQKTTK